MSTLWIGIDISKAKMDVAIEWQGMQQTMGEFANNVVGFGALRTALQEMQEHTAAPELHLIVEPTGGYELPLIAFAHEESWTVSLPNPRQVRQWARGTGQRAKTDRQDALMLARFGAAQRPAPHHPLAAEINELDSLLERRLDLEEMIQQEKNRLDALRERAREAPGIAPPVLENLQRVLDALQDALQEVEQAIAHHLKQHTHLHEDAQRLLAIPGIGPKIVLPLLVLLHRWQTLTAGQGTAKGLTAFVGLDPRPHESGWSVRKRPSISKMGDATLRRLLYMGALSAVHGRGAHWAPLRTFYLRLVGFGKAKKLSVVAAARKLLSWAWVIFSRQVEWNSALHST
jgi:transposase